MTHTLKHVFLEFISLIFTMILVVAAVYTDIVILKNQLHELSITEFSQSTLILLSSILFFVKINKEPCSAGLFILITCLFTMIFLREGDYYFDFVYHGFWKVPVLFTLVIGLYYAYQNKDTILTPLYYYQTGKAFTYTLIGLLITIVFSRIFGTRSLWLAITPENSGFIKTVVQEGLELLGYSLVFLGAIAVQFETKNTSTNK